MLCREHMAGAKARLTRPSSMSFGCCLAIVTVEAPASILIPHHIQITSRSHTSHPHHSHITSRPRQIHLRIRLHVHTASTSHPPRHPDHVHVTATSQPHPPPPSPLQSHPSYYFQLLCFVQVEDLPAGVPVSAHRPHGLYLTSLQASCSQWMEADIQAFHMAAIRFLSSDIVRNQGRPPAKRLDVDS